MSVTKPPKISMGASNEPAVVIFNPRKTFATEPVAQVWCLDLRVFVAAKLRASLVGRGCSC